MTKPKILIIPGNGDSHIETDHWYGWLRDKLVQMGYEVIARDMPDPVIAHMNIWLPYIENILKTDENAIIIGHSSGGVAALRYLEHHKLIGAIIIGTNYTDLGLEDEKESGYYQSPWDWQAIKGNAKWIVHFASTDDPYIDISEPRYIHDQLGTEYYELSDRGHFMVSHNPINSTFPEIPSIIQTKLG